MFRPHEISLHFNEVVATVLESTWKTMGDILSKIKCFRWKAINGKWFVFSAMGLREVISSQDTVCGGMDKMLVSKRVFWKRKVESFQYRAFCAVIWHGRIGPPASKHICSRACSQTVKKWVSLEHLADTMCCQPINIALGQHNNLKRKLLILSPRRHPIIINPNVQVKTNY